MPGVGTWLSRLSFLCVTLLLGGVFFSVRADAPAYSSDIHISEFLPHPLGGGTSGEFIELHNGSADAVDVSGWKLDDVADGGSSPFTISVNTIIPAGEYLAFYTSSPHVSLNDDGDHVRLLLPDGVTIRDDVVYGKSIEGYSYNRLNDGAYVQSSISTPNAENMLDPTPTPIPSPTPTATPAILPTVSPSPTVSPVYSQDVRINEFIPNPTGDDATLEFIELYNDSTDVVDMSGWKLDDIVDGGSPPFVIPDDTTIPARGYIVFHSSQTKLSLNNDSEHVRLISPNDVVRDDIVYSSSKDGYSYNYVDDGDFQQSDRPTPGEQNVIEVPTPTPTPTLKPSATSKPTSSPVTYDFSSKIVINEVYPNLVKDDKNNEFIEIKNLDNRLVSLAGWTLDDEDGGSRPYHFKSTDKIGAKKILLLDKLVTKIALNNGDDSVRLLDPHGKVVAILAYQKTYAGQSLSRTEEGLYQWTEILTPGQENIIRVQESVIPIKKNTTTKSVKVSRPRVAGLATFMPSPAISADWPSLLPGPVLRTVYGEAAVSTAKQKQVIFVFLGFLAAGSQLVAGISRKEKIWFN